ncbi:MAG: ribosome biogenesis GTPase Der [Dehalococcoidia bacterium]|nr:ribosome biogenesis GTPase Der [Dehalococcoidia bacterium]
MSKPSIVIVGRPNVGKSTLFNRLVGRRAAVVTDIPGTTRDRIALDAEWWGHRFIVVDTGGLEAAPTTPMYQQVVAQAMLAMETADAIIFVTDVHDGPTPADMDISHQLRRTGKPVVLAVNKTDNSTLEQETMEFYRLGLGDPIAISAHHNRGIDDLMDAVMATIPQEEEAENDVTGLLSLAIVGRTNVGKSALLNAILGEERVIVSETPGTTRDAIDTPTIYQDQKMLLIDTAGIRRPGRVEQGIETYSVLRTLRAVDRADVVFLVLDAADMVAAQDTHIAGHVIDAFKGLVIVVNKWDLATQLGLDEAGCLEEIRQRFKFLPYAPVRFTSALNKTGVAGALDAALMVYRDCSKEVSHHKLYSAVLDAMAENQPSSRKGRLLRLKGVAQEGVRPPTFVFYVNDASLAHFSYRRYLENRLRETLAFRWSHLKLVFKDAKE